MPEGRVRTAQKRAVGLMMLATLCAVIYLLYYLREQAATSFSEHYSIHAIVDRADAIRVGTQVTLAGISVGDVVALEITADNQIRVVMDLTTKYRSKIRGDSQATLINPTFGNAHIDISIGSANLDPIDAGGEIELVQAASLMDVVSTLPKRLEQLDLVIANHVRLSDGLVNPDGDLQQSLARLNAGLDGFANLTADLRRSEHQLFQTLAAFEQVTARSVAVVDGVVLTQQKLNAILDSAAGALDDIGTGTEQLPAHADKFGVILEELRAAAVELRTTTPQLGRLIAQSRDVLEEADRTLRASQKNFLIAPHIESPTRDISDTPPRDPALARPHRREAADQ